MTDRRRFTEEDDRAFFQAIKAEMPEDSRRVIDGLVKIQSVYVASGRDDALDVAFKGFMNAYLAGRLAPRSGPAKEPDVFFLTGETGAGKSSAIQRVLGSHPALRTRQMPYGEVRPYVSIKLKGYTHPRLVGQQIVREAGYGMVKRTERGEIWDEMADLLHGQQVFLVHIDEAQHLLTEKSTDREKRQLSDAIKGVSIDTHWPIAFVLSGLPEVVGLPIFDGQVERRGNFLHLEKLTMPDDRDLVVRIVEGLCEPVGVDASHLFKTDLPDRLAHAAAYGYGRVCQAVTGALQEALHWDRKYLTVGHFATAYERRSLAYGMDEKNPFLEEHWKLLRPGAYLVVPTEPAIP